MGLGRKGEVEAQDAGNRTTKRGSSQVNLKKDRLKCTNVFLNVRQKSLFIVLLPLKRLLQPDGILTGMVVGDSVRGLIFIL